MPEASIDRIVRSLLEAPELVSTVSSLQPALVTTLIEQVGLEDCAELIGFLSAQQLNDAFDDDLWDNEHSEEDGGFDSKRFALWLELMSEAGPSFVSDRLAQMPEDLLSFALHSLTIVLGVEELILAATTRHGEDAARIEAALASFPSEELGDYLVIARQLDGWDSILFALLALDAEEHELLGRVLERCAALALDEVEEQGSLFDVLTRHEMTAADVRDERDVRRRRRGFVSKEDAELFMKRIGQSSLEDLIARPIDGLFRAYQQDLDPPTPLDLAQVHHALSALDIAPDALSNRLLPSSTSPSAFEQAMADLRDRASERYELYTEQMVFLANVLLATSEAITKIDAARAVLEHVNEGMDHVGTSRIDEHSPIHLFQIGVRLQAS